MHKMNESDHQQVNRESYNLGADAYEKKFSTYRPYLQVMEDFLSLVPPSSRVLDVGCGPGILAKLATDHGHLVTGVDTSIEMIEKARGRNPAGKFLVMGADEIDHLREKFNVVVASFVVVHMNDSEVKSFLAKLSRLLDEAESYLYLSYMTGKTSGYETTGFSADRRIYFHYHNEEAIRRQVEEYGFQLFKRQQQSYEEPDGSLTPDIFMFFRRGIDRRRPSIA